MPDVRAQIHRNDLKEDCSFPERKAHTRKIAGVNNKKNRDLQYIQFALRIADIGNKMKNKRRLRGHIIAEMGTVNIDANIMNLPDIPIYPGEQSPVSSGPDGTQ